MNKKNENGFTPLILACYKGNVAVVDYLIKEGIAADRLVAKGYGETLPKVSDAEIAKLKTTAEQEKAHRKNRRTEYKIIAR